MIIIIKILIKILIYINKINYLKKIYKFKNNNKDIQIMSKYSINHNYKIIKKCVNLLMVINKKSLKLEIIKYLINKINPNFLINKT
jgi:hypothetical protein